VSFPLDFLRITNVSPVTTLYSFGTLENKTSQLLLQPMALVGGSGGLNGA
jgi:hypothetical protein